MAKEHIQVRFDTTDVEKTEMLIALLSNLGYAGFEETESGLMAFIHSDGFSREELDELATKFSVPYTTNSVKEQNWNAVWESSFDPIIVNDFAAIREGFHAPVNNVRYEVVITPKMSFGTGHHATTYMMIEQMSGLDMNNRSVVDFGTGTGVLAILAEKMGARSVDAIDNDEWSIENAKENMATNDCKAIQLLKAESLETQRTYDIILANINLNVIVDNLPAIASASLLGTLVLLSGFLKPDETTVLQHTKSLGLQHLNTLQKGDWICLKLQKD